MKRTDIVTTVGRKYLTANIENDEFSYQKALKETAYIPTAKVGVLRCFSVIVSKKELSANCKEYPFCAVAQQVPKMSTLKKREQKPPIFFHFSVDFAPSLGYNISRAK